MGDLLYWINLTKKEYFGHCHKETEWTLNPESMIPLIDLFRFGRWTGDQLMLGSFMDIESIEKNTDKMTDISKEVYEQ